MSTAATLLKRAAALHRAVKREPKTWVLVLETGESIPDDIRAQIRPGDQIVIREIPKGWLRP